MVILHQTIRQQLMDHIRACFAARFEGTVTINRLERICAAVEYDAFHDLAEMGFLQDLDGITSPQANVFETTVHCDVNWTGTVVWQYFSFRRKHTRRARPFFAFELTYDGDTTDVQLVGEWDDRKTKAVVDYLTLLKLSHHEQLALPR